MSEERRTKERRITFPTVKMTTIRVQEHILKRVFIILLCLFTLAGIALVIISRVYPVQPKVISITVIENEATEDGLQGPKGSTGKTGKTGKQGAQGEQGEEGKNGKNFWGNR